MSFILAMLSYAVTTFLVVISLIFMGASVFGESPKEYSDDAMIIVRVAVFIVGVAFAACAILLGMVGLHVKNM